MSWPGAPTIYYADEAGQVGWTDPDDRRSTIIRISKRGNEILSEYQEIYNSLLGSIYNQIDATPEDIATFGKVLSQIHLALKQRWEQYLETKAAGAI